ncbi:hypothetical protein AWI35_19175 [Klebsiella aerogenes]|nr:hypothetical protein YA38_25250 [Klebsiella aerogenes]KUR10742.1 hypothetical protein AWI35_19175 [Klebsiella aerogenes]KZR04455.1 hypothetical protein A3N63_21940 [Klebsiella aerogenes]KZR16092.1 hypothetical protein A3N65_01785 [Klebsiella aerogenes]
MLVKIKFPFKFRESESLKSFLANELMRFASKIKLSSHNIYLLANLKIHGKLVLKNKYYRVFLNHF